MVSVVMLGLLGQSTTAEKPPDCWVDGVLFVFCLDDFVREQPRFRVRKRGRLGGLSVGFWFGVMVGNPCGVDVVDA